MITKLLSLSITSALMSSQAIAHPGDHLTGTVLSAIWHQINEPDHLLIAGLVAVVIFGGVKAYMKKKA